MPCDESSLGGLIFVLTCEHACGRLPASYGTLGLPTDVLRSHWSYDVGAAQVARRLARDLGCSYFEGRYSRLLIDLNRSETHRRLIPTTAGRLRIRPNEEIPVSERDFRLERYWRPYRSAAEARICSLSRSRGMCVHVALHSFVPVLNGRRHTCDVGILYDPNRARERFVARQLCSALRSAGAIVRLNYPYRGTADGFTTALRRRLSPAGYAGLEIELNQSLLARAPRRRGVVIDALGTALKNLVQAAVRSRADRAKSRQKCPRDSWRRLRSGAISD